MKRLRELLSLIISGLFQEGLSTVFTAYQSWSLIPAHVYCISFAALQVNGKLQTSNPDVYAVGDVAAFPLTKYGITTRQEHVAHARGSATQAVSHIMSPKDTEDYYYLPFFYSRIFNLSWQVRELLQYTKIFQGGSPWPIKSCFPASSYLVL